MDQPLLKKTLSLLRAACPEINPETAAKMSIGERDARLLLLRQWLFGSRLLNMAECPGCSERIEWDTDINSIRLQPIQQDSTPGEFDMKIDKYTIRFRLPNSLDIANVVAGGTGQPAAAELLSYCIIEFRKNGKTCNVKKLPEKVRQAVNKRMEEESPQADIRMTLTCPFCSFQWEVHFDITGYLWTEIDSWAERVLQDIHVLAGAYGWSEYDILDMSPVRRHLYLRMVNR